MFPLSTHRFAPLSAVLRKRVFASTVCLLLVVPAIAQPWARRNIATPDEAREQSANAIAQLNPFLNDIGYAQLRARTERVKALTTQEDAEHRQAEVRRKITALVGGIPVTTGPVAVRTFATVPEMGFHLENIAYESAPDYWVTANVYVPPGAGPFPAVIIAPGHGSGKSSQFNWGANLARAGILVLSIDPMGQGERLQHFDPELGASKIERSGEHEHANQSALLVGQHIARYWFADGIRGVDYLTQRLDVDVARIGTFGCSGGGTAAAYLAAMDPRISVAAVSSFITSFKELLPGNGPQDAEQTLPGFIAAGLDFADWVELAAPRPYAIIAFEEDFFPIDGALETHAEAARFYSLFEAEDQLELIHGPGGHCNLRAVSDELFAFLFKHLKGVDAPVPTLESLRPRHADTVLVTPTGQLSTSIGSRIALDFTRQALANISRPAGPLKSHAELASWRDRIETDVRQLTAATVTPDDLPRVSRANTRTTDGYRLQSVSFASEPGITIEGILATPSGTGPHPVVVWLDALPLDRIIAEPDFQRLARTGHTVLALHPRGVLGEPDPNPNRLALGQYMPVLLRAHAVGKTLIGMRVDDTLRALNWLASQPESDLTSVSLYGKGAQGLVALHAAVLDERITRVLTENTIVSYRSAVEAGLHKNLSEIVIPGVLTRYDTPDLLIALSPRPVTLINPTNAMGQRRREPSVRSALAPVFETNLNLGEPARVSIVHRDFRDPIPFP